MRSIYKLVNTKIKVSNKELRIFIITKEKKKRHLKKRYECFLQGEQQGIIS